MRLAIMVIAAAALLGGSAQAHSDPSAAAKDAVATAPAAKKVLVVCDGDEASWRAFSRDLGLPEFVTARQVRAAEGKAWSGPKCITPSELRRLTGGEQVSRLTRK